MDYSNPTFWTCDRCSSMGLSETTDPPEGPGCNREQEHRWTQITRQHVLDHHPEVPMVGTKAFEEWAEQFET